MLSVFRPSLALCALYFVCCLGHPVGPQDDGGAASESPLSKFLEPIKTTAQEWTKALAKELQKLGIKDPCGTSEPPSATPSYVGGLPLSSPRPDPPPKRLVPDLDTVKDACQRMPSGDCLHASLDLDKKSKDVMKDFLAQPRKIAPSAKSKTDDEIAVYLDTMLEAKKAVFAANNLDSNLVTPHDNGLWGGDTLPTLDLLRRIIKDCNDTDPSVSKSNSTSSKRRKRATGISLDYYTGNKWPSLTVNYYIDPYTFTQTEADTIRTSVKTIQDKTCMTFSETLETPYIEFLKTPYGTPATTCGWASLGYSGDVNDAAVNFDSSLCTGNLQGTIVHEVLHVLGISHEHNRYDRDQYIEMDWSNVDPQSYDIYGHDNYFDYNPYCVGYDYLSVMHYSPYVAVIDASKPAFKPKTNQDYYLPLIGATNVPSVNDLALINRLYCSPSTCRDVTPNCGWTACNDCSTYGESCPKSCGQCQS